MELPVLRRHSPRHDRRHDARRGPDVTGEAPPGSAERAMVCRTPWAELAELHERMGRMLYDPIGAGFGALAPAGFGVEDAVAADSVAGWRPAADVEETDDAFLVELELPGIKREDVSVEFGGGELSVHGEVKRKERVGLLRSRTRPVGQFHYRVSLPGEAVQDQVSASLVEGVLTVRVPKTDRSRRRQIKITG